MQSVQIAEQKQLAALRAKVYRPLPLRTRDQAIVREPAKPPTPEPETPVRIVAEDNPPPERPGRNGRARAARQARQGSVGACGAACSGHHATASPSPRHHRQKKHLCSPSSPTKYLTDSRIAKPRIAKSESTTYSPTVPFVLTFSHEQATGSMDDSRL